MTSTSRQAAGSEVAVKGKALYLAAQAGKINEVTRLLGKKADINYVYKVVEDGKEFAQTALMAAVRGGHAEVAKFLITRKANVNLAEPCHGRTALHHAARIGDIPMIELLISNGAMLDVRDNNANTPLHYAALNCHKKAVSCLLDQGSDVNAALEGGVTALHLTADVGSIQMIEFIMSKGAKHNVRDKAGHTPLHVAAANGHKEAVNCLLDHGADINAVNQDGRTALHNAAGNGHLEVVKLLVLKGADMKKEGRGLTPPEGAALFGHEKVVDFLIKSEARFSETGTAAKDCKFCGKVDPVNMLRCIGCKSINYCCSECQKSDWHDHKARCKSIKAMREKYMHMGGGIKQEVVEKLRNFDLEKARPGPSSPPPL